MIATDLQIQQQCLAGDRAAVGRACGGAPACACVVGDEQASNSRSMPPGTESGGGGGGGGGGQCRGCPLGSRQTRVEVGISQSVTSLLALGGTEYLLQTIDADKLAEVWHHSARQQNGGSMLRVTC